MKNLKIKVKLLLSFSIITMFTIMVGLTGIIGLENTKAIYSESYHLTVKALNSLGDLRELIQSEQLALHAIIVNIEDVNKLEENINELKIKEDTMLNAMAVYESTIFDASAETDYYAFKDSYLSSFKNVKEQILDSVNKGDYDRAKATLIGDKEIIDTMVEHFKGTLSYVNETSEVIFSDISNKVLFIRIIQIVIITLTSIIAMMLGLYLSAIISTPLGYMAKALNQIGTTGNLALDPQTAQSATDERLRKDEIGTCARAAIGLITHLNNLSTTLATISKGDLRANITILSQDDTIGNSVNLMVNQLNDMFSEVYSSTKQVSIASRQIADSSQNLAKDSTQQAAAVEELSSTISDISSNTKENANMSEKAAALANTIMVNAKKGSQQMDEMMSAVKDINQASHNINKVIKVIDDIAFQTNILALNAAVEAARAGSAGKGFAVVAEEVRNLASKSAEAAKDTSLLINNSIEKAELGTHIAEETSISLSEIVTGINESSELISKIYKSSAGQSEGIYQINIGIDQVSTIIQQNNAVAEESAAVSEEMNDQVITLENLIGQFKLRKEG